MNLRKLSPLIYCGTGLVAGLLLAFSLGAGDHTGGRFQLKVWSTPPGGAYSGDHGVYRIDTETGDVWVQSPNSNGLDKMTAK